MPRPKVLFVASDSQDAAEIQIRTEFKRIGEFLQKTPGYEAFEFIHVPGGQAGDLPALLQRLKPDVVHFAGHADSDGRLMLEEAEFDRGVVEPDALHALFNTAIVKPKLVLFNTCYGTAAAEAVVKQVPRCIGTPALLEDGVAIQFASFFYQGLGFGKTIKQAFEYASAGVMLSQGTLPVSQRPAMLHSKDVKDISLVPSPLKKVFLYVAGASVASILLAFLLAILVLPRFGWLAPQAVKKNLEENLQLTSKVAHLKREMVEFGVDETSSNELPPNVISFEPRTAKESRPVKKIGDANLTDREKRQLDAWQSGLFDAGLGPNEQLLVLHSMDSFKPPYKTCSYRLDVDNLRVSRIAAFLMRNRGGDAQYRPTYRQLYVEYKPEEAGDVILKLDQPRRDEQLFVFLWVSSFYTTKENIESWKGSRFSVKLIDRRPG